MQIRITKASVVNFLLYEECTINLDNTGLVFIVGEHTGNASGAWTSNGAGKTSLLSIVPWIIWGKILRDVREVNRVIRHGCDFAWGRLEGFIDDVPFFIERMRSLEAGIKLTTSLTESTREPEVQQVINQTLGSHTLGMSTIILAQRKALEFITAGDAARKQLMEELLRIFGYSVARTRVHDDIKYFKDSISKLQDKLSIDNQRYEGLFSGVVYEQNLRRTEYTAKLELLCHRRDELLGFIKLSREQVEEYTISFQAARYKYLRLTEQLQARDSNLLLSSTKLMETKQRIDGEIKTYMELLAGSRTCRTCKQPWPNNIPREELQAALDKLMVERSQFQLELQTHNETYQGGSLPLLNEQSQLCKVMDGVELALINSQSMLKHHELELVKTEASIEIYEGELAQQPPALAEQVEELVRMRTLNLLDEQKLETLKEGLKYVEYWDTAFSYKGIPSFLIEQSLPVLNEHTNAILADLTDGQFTVSVESTDVVKSTKAVVDKINFRIWEMNREVELTDCSEGQQRRIVIALFLALSQVQHIITGVSWNFRLVDELFDILDDAGIERILKILKKLTAESIPTIIVASHRSELQSTELFSTTWTVKRGSESSVVCT